ncbi:MAG: Undecaprenyl-phosphate alpha-N-acetylglucosaminyl 1-phosphate transferase [uncultured Rubrobacteraceae bacterium]|uniref:Undecaprenyl-phosphate alpha-N-acetylglucosaminyl 1-phosphate transferase n=1 Tax=uncultured Rubrobacteraceae bacterium TaxID=349277 RepID=A0A6J4Q3T0_9ACTN|nr:MAG: Undecaprenyl-phosphate alpha-N-acetylglucosaminyl 1-phosphate transferase [uncultured Rubrobacteraceae bacterium]
MTVAVVAGGLAFLVAGALVPLLVKFAVGRSLLDVPNLRSSHEVPTPRLGGVAIFVGTLVGVGVLWPGGAWPLLAAAALIWAVGLADDLSNLHFKTKAAAQTLVAASLILLYPPPVLSEAPGVLWPLVFAVGVFWIVALSNAFNFMDGIDGFTGGVAVVNAFFLIPLAGEAGAFLPALVGATAGFLVWNINPASMFIGDSGAYFVGFVLAAVALYAPVPPGGSWTPLGFVAVALIFLPYLFDTAFTLLRRLRSGAGKSIFLAHREHIYQRITPTVALHRRTSNLYYGASVAAGLAALLVSQGGVGLLFGSILALALCATLAALPKMVG